MGVILLNGVRINHVDNILIFLGKCEFLIHLLAGNFLDLVNKCQPNRDFSVP